MQLPEPYSNMSVLTGGSRDDVRGYEHSVSVLMPWRRYRQTRHPPESRRPSGLDGVGRCPEVVSSYVRDTGGLPGGVGSEPWRTCELSGRPHRVSAGAA